MPYYCVLCKKEPIPGDKSRSFHKFPDNDDLKGKWMSLVGINSVTKYTKLCSDHFDMSAYEDCNGHTTKRCLLKTAVPCRLLCTDKIQSGSYSVVKGQTQLNLQEQQCSSNVCENNVIDVLPSINNDLSTNTNRAFNKKKENFGELSNSIVSDSCVAVDCHTTSDLSKSLSVTVVLDTSNNLSKTHCASILKNNPCTQMLKEQVMQKTLFSNAQCNDDYTNLKRSLPDTNCSKNSDVSPSKKICPSNVLDLSLPDSNCSESSDVSPSEKMCPSNIFESNHAKNLSNHLESNEAGKNVKRHMSYIDISDIPPTKKFRFFDGPQPMCISRKDFATDEAWSRFLKFTIYKKRQAESCRKKNQRKSKQIGNIKELVSILREENATAAADYLQTSNPTPESSQLQQVEALTKLPEVLNTSGPTPESSQTQLVEALTKLPETSGPTPESSQTQLVEDLTKLPEAEEIILNVYNYLKTEYDSLKSVAGDSCDLSPLANILKRTAQATGVNEPTVTAILQGNNREKPGERLKTSGKKRRKRRREVENVVLSPIEEDSDFKTTDDEQHANDDIEQMAQEHVGIETVKLEIHEEDIEHSVAMREAMMSNVEPAASGETPTVQVVMSPPYFEIKTEPVDVEFSRQPQHCTAVDPLTLDTQLGDVELPAQHAPPDPGEMDSAGSSTHDRLIVTTKYN